jgi:hypothetical protein
VADENIKEIIHPLKCQRCRRKGVILVWNEIKKAYEELLCMKCREESK